MHLIMWWARACHLMTAHRDSSRTFFIFFVQFGSCLSTRQSHRHQIQTPTWPRSLYVCDYRNNHTLKHARRDHIILASNACGCTCANKSYVTSSCGDTVYGNNEHSNDRRRQVVWKSAMHDTTHMNVPNDHSITKYNVYESIYNSCSPHYPIEKSNQHECDTTIMPPFIVQPMPMLCIFYENWAKTCTSTFRDSWTYWMNTVRYQQTVGNNTQIVLSTCSFSEWTFRLRPC